MLPYIGKNVGNVGNIGNVGTIGNVGNVGNIGNVGNVGTIGNVGNVVTHNLEYSSSQLGALEGVINDTIPHPFTFTPGKVIFELIWR